MYPHGRPAFAAMTLGTSYAAEASERFCIYPGRTCGFAAKISVSLSDRSVGEPLIDLEGDRAARAVVFGLLARDAL
jgi:hypothetical protein